MRRQSIEVRSVDVDGLRMNVATAGGGPALLLVHGIPHTWFLWRRIIARLASRFLVIAPDLRGLGGTQRAEEGFDVATVSGDLAGLLDVLDIPNVATVGIDLGVQTAFMLAASSPNRVRGMALMEGLVGDLPGAESFLSRGAPWWFGFHSVAELPETLISGHEAAYVDYFLTNGTYQRRGVPPEARDAFVRAYSGRESIRCMCDHYRAFPMSARQISEVAISKKLAVPTLAIEGGVVGKALVGQLRSVATDLSTAAVQRTAHIIPEDEPDQLLSAMEPFLMSL